ncbi:MAG TPA: phosphohydrolase [Baekduia sp.]|nr:phosphohydrolase [Baekduia sp.]
MPLPAVVEQDVRSLDERVAAATIRAPARGNRKLDRLLNAVNDDVELKAWWHAAAINAERLEMSDHSWVHIQIVTNIGLRLARLLFRRGVVPSVVADHGLTERDAEVVIASAALFHCVGMSIHRADHEQFSLFLTADKLPKLLAPIYDDPTRSIIVAEASHAIISHRSRGAPFTIEGAILRVADALDMAKGRSRADKLLPNIHSVSSKAIESVKILPGREKAVRIEIEMSNSAGIYQVDEGLGTKLRGTPLAEHLEVVARIDAEHEQRLVPVFRL